MIAVEGEGAKYWPVWRGPSRPGTGDRELSGSMVRTENVLWKTRVPGRGNSSPIVWARPDLPDVGSRLRASSVARCIPALGRRAVVGDVPAGWPDKPCAREKRPRIGHPSTDGTYIYASFGSRGLAAFDFNESSYGIRRSEASTTITAPPVRRSSTTIASSSTRISGRAHLSEHLIPSRANRCGGRRVPHMWGGARRSSFAQRTATS
jgi:hypothetical protein